MRKLLFGLIVLAIAGALGAITYPFYENLDIYQVKSGDTLWDISGWYLGNHWAWPAIYEANSPYLADPVYRNGLIIVWIYPGDHLIMPGGPLARPYHVTLFTPDKKAYGSFIDWPKNYEKYGEIVREDYYEHENVDHEQAMLSQWDPFVIDRGANANVKVGDKFWIFGVDKIVNHPVQKKTQVGSLIRFKGLGEIQEVYERVSKGRIVRAFEPIYVHDRVMPWEPTLVPAFKGYEKPASYNEGYVVQIRDSELDITYDIVYIDKGTRNGVGDGDVFEVYRPEKTRDNRFEQKVVIPVTVIAKLLVINARATTSTCYVFGAKTRNVLVGDHVRHALKAITFYPQK
ncbi:MAG: LysM peptidoglycan-binding domain-containing protein [Candidatus Coatesbacteria bacterium]|nr:LysM peptidoglycan-binding domain-containing protein [Candidatus Coatesbacteria bacterium]